MLNFIVVCLVTTVGLLIISKLPIGVEIDSFPKALISALVFGLLNVFVRPILGVLAFPINIIFADWIVRLLLNIIIFGLAAVLVEGFRLRNGFLSALLGAVSLALITALIRGVLPV